MHLTKKANSHFRKLRFLLSVAMLAIGLIGLSSQPLLAQPREVTSPPPPSAEQYKASTDILVPWRDGCTHLVFNMHRCTMPRLVMVDSHVLALYKADGSIWGVYDTYRKAPNYYANAPELLPIAHLGGRFRGGPVLRIKGESEHWYQVIVNEDAGTVGYALKVPFDPQQIGMWAKTTFEYWLLGDRYLQRRSELSPLLDAPNGKPVPGDDLRIWQLEFLKLDRPGGEWAYVKANEDLAGWVRLRDGKKFFLWTYFSLGLWNDDVKK